MQFYLHFRILLRPKIWYVMSAFPRTGFGLGVTQSYHWVVNRILYLCTSHSKNKNTRIQAYDDCVSHMYYKHVIPGHAFGVFELCSFDKLLGLQWITNCPVSPHKLNVIFYSVICKIIWKGLDISYLSWER